MNPESNVSAKETYAKQIATTLKSSLSIGSK